MKSVSQHKLNVVSGVDTDTHHHSCWILNCVLMVPLLLSGHRTFQHCGKCFKLTEQFFRGAESCFSCGAAQTSQTFNNSFQLRLLRTEISDIMKHSFILQFHLERCVFLSYGTVFLHSLSQ